MTPAMLEIEGLQTYFFTEEAVVRAVDGVDIRVEAGQTVGIVGESGCGKSVTSLSIMRLLEDGGGRVVAGTIRFKGRDLLALSDEKMRQVRGREIAMIFQEPMTSLNPILKIGEQVAEGIRLHLKLDKKRAWQKAAEALKAVGIPRTEAIMREYPYQLSGGMRQRVMIAMAMSCEPALLIADEPTTALDVTIQAQILDLMRKLKEAKSTAILFITHDLGVVAEMCDRVLVMYAGQVVEEADVKTIFGDPRHPYTRGLLSSIPKPFSNQRRLGVIPGNVPVFKEVPSGCRFAERCSVRNKKCFIKSPPLQSIKPGHFSRCWLVGPDHENEDNSGRRGTSDER
ncbi:oligopeptide transport ATP-binding protein OppD [Peptococcaceae bacterium CEB3]|nr:oligopeptide transport ATP-binding protein OppD [Peptococcaceae bacterium CEB3]